MSPLSVIFCGTSDFAVPTLHSLAGDKRFTVTHVITQPDRPTGRKQLLTPPPVKTAALKAGIPVLQPENINRGFDLAALPRPDFLVVVAFGQILGQAVLDFAKELPVNVHGSLLPRWRGASPIQHAILAGDTESGVTVQRMVKALDAGAILSQQATPLEPRETFQTLHDRLAMMGAKLLPQTLANTLSPKEQNESEVTVCRKLSREDGVADPNTKSAIEIDRRVRGLNPWPGVRMTIKAQTIKVLASSLEPVPGSWPVDCVSGTTLHLVTVQPPGKKPMEAIVWARGLR